MKIRVETKRMIGPEAAFYGYIVGLQLERGDLPDSPEVPARMFARFEYSGRTSIGEVPDHELFRILAGHIADNVQMRDEHGEGDWLVELP